MSLVLRRTCLKAKDHFKSQKPHVRHVLYSPIRSFSDERYTINNPDFSCSTILVENGFNVQELPIVIRKLKNITCSKDEDLPIEANTTDPSNYNLIQAEFQECTDLREVFSLLSKCTKITPNIALGAMERIYDIEQSSNSDSIQSNHVNLAKGAILDKLLKVVTKTEDTQTIINVLKSNSIFMEPFKYKFCDELLLRCIDNKMSVEQLCSFTQFLIENKAIPKYAETIDKLWVGFIEKENDINESNIALVFDVIKGLKLSKRIVFCVLEQRLSELWSKIQVPVMQEILNRFAEEKYLSPQSLSIIGWWLHTNIHALDEETLLDVVLKITRLGILSDRIEKAIEKYMKLKGEKIESHVLIVGILNYCMQFQIQNKVILNSCSQYLVRNIQTIPSSFLKAILYPFGYLCFDPSNSHELWDVSETILLEKSTKINLDDISSILLSYLYLGKYPLKLTSKVLSSDNIIKLKHSEVLRNLHLVDTALALECKEYIGPLIPKDQWPEPVLQDNRIKNIVNKIYKSLEDVAGGPDKISTHVMVPHFSDKTYLIDVMFHPAGLGDATFNWKVKTSRNQNIAILIHFPEHYCSDNVQLIGPQVMRKRHLKILGFKVVSVKYSTISQFYTSYKTNELRQYLIESVKNAEESL